ncbi:NAD(P)-dependent oxidoreductase [Tessaracoccus lapidicaptus]|uniref:NAD(P)-dependent oxidoreductase n=1 Tax=Tessaracoccus lapidicaptus TaxID=1427523 RepID=UPI0033425351
MRIAIIGATGMVGSRIAAEAVQRGHEVVAYSRSGGRVDRAVESRTLDLGDTAAVVAAGEDADAAVVAVPPDRTGGSHEPTLAAHRTLIAAAPATRLLIVGGAGSLEVEGGSRLKDLPGFPPEYYPEADTFTTVLEEYRASSGLDWTLLSPAPVISPGERTGSYVVGGDSPVGDTISAEDFAVAVVDELEEPKHRGRRFAVAN